MILASHSASTYGSRDLGSSLARPEIYGNPTKMRDSNMKIVILCFFINLTFHIL